LRFCPDASDDSAMPARQGGVESIHAHNVLTERESGAAEIHPMLADEAYALWHIALGAWLAGR
jgi:hypothetical protein